MTTAYRRTLTWVTVTALAATAGLIFGVFAAVVDLDRVLAVELVALLGAAPLAPVTMLRGRSRTDTARPYGAGSWIVDTRHSGFAHQCIVTACEKAHQTADARYVWRVTWRTVAGEESSTLVDSDGFDASGRVYPPAAEPTADALPSPAAAHACSCCGDHTLAASPHCEDCREDLNHMCPPPPIHVDSITDLIARQTAQTARVNEQAVAAEALLCFWRSLTDSDARGKQRLADLFADLVVADDDYEAALAAPVYRHAPGSCAGDDETPTVDRAASARDEALAALFGAIGWTGSAS